MSKLPESFTTAKQNIAANLTRIMQHLSYTPTLMAMQLNAISSTNVLSTDITSWSVGEKLPSIYQLYKLSQLLEIDINTLFSEELLLSKPVDTIINVSLVDDKQLDNQTPNMEKTNMATKNTIVSISKTSKRKMDEVVRARTTSRTYNMLLANKIYSSDMTLKDIAAQVGTSTRSLRDYSFYNTTVPAEIASALVKIFSTSYRNLGLYFNSDTNRYEHMKIVTK